jgi:pimeloyl-ACP methyl ester carboxylesterase
MLSDMTGSDNTFYRRHKGWTAFLLLVFLVVVFQSGRRIILPNEQQLRHAFHLKVQAWFPEPARHLAQRQGINPFRDEGESENRSFQGRVVLVHGLDDPGIMWDDLAPILWEKQFQVYIMSYPNDQAIRASSKFFFDSMQDLAQTNSSPVFIVAHSMGGLVARDMLTCPKINYSRAAAAGKVPDVKRLILVGTPNQGAQMARFRIITEIKDQIFHLFKPGTHWLHCLLDGTGAAGVDLLPGSRFLTQLNQRPLPGDVPIDIIAGMMFFSREPTDVENMLGDGLVSVNATRLNDLPLIRVPGNHFSMIRNLTRSSTRVPPAIPEILAKLE